jgi:galactitol-specific phosphotransferase system IIB component
MKKHYNILILFILIPFLGFSNDDTFISKEKNIKKTFIVNSNAGIDIENKYGNITVSTWDENKIDLDITIKVSGGNENWVNERLSSIDVDINALKSMVTAITNIGNSSLKSRGSSNSFEINYVIKIPKNGTVKLNNKYGNITTLTLESTTDISCKYGKIILGKLNGDSNRIEIGYSQNSSIDYIKSGNIEARYSGIKINESGNLNVDANYTDVSLQEGQNIKCKGNYGSFKFQKINSLVGSSNYVTISIAEVLNNLNIDATYSKINVESMSEKSKNVNINTGYTNIALGYDANYSFDFDINTRYGSIKNDSSLEVLVSEIKSNTKRISGYNKKKGQNKVIINSSYGNIILTKR